MNWLHPYPKAYNLYQLTSKQEDFEKAYLAARTLEFRLYSDEIVRQLPYLDSKHPQVQEWTLRQANTKRVLTQLAKLPKEAKVLDLGCGNGWFTGRIAASCPAKVLGADINERELIQAASLFASDHCHFAYGDIFSGVWPNQYFDVIVLNSCIQYFPSLPDLIKRLQDLLTPSGVIHILDSPIYDRTSIAAAKSRTQSYYQQQGVTAMNAHYHHHCWKDLGAFKYQIKYNPNSILNKIRRKFFKDNSPFPWVEISLK